MISYGVKAECAALFITYLTWIYYCWNFIWTALFFFQSFDPL